MLTPLNLSHALKYVTEESVQKRVMELSKNLLSENGVNFAVDKIEKTLHRKL